MFLALVSLTTKFFLYFKIFFEKNLIESVD